MGNKDLEIIKRTCIDVEFVLKADMKDIIEAAERMAERIEELEKQNQYYIEQVGEYQIQGNAYRAELAAAKPITCGECGHSRHQSYCWHYERRIEPNDFCSAAVRKEATDVK